MPPARTNMKNPYRTAITVGALIFLSLVGGSIIFLQANRDDTDCQHHNYNDKLNGGVKEFAGKKYTIDICGSGTNNNHFFGDGMDSVKLTISDSQGEILARRYYKVFWDGRPGHEQLMIGPDSITYQDDEKQKDYTIAMPPATIDWIRARLPFF